MRTVGELCKLRDSVFSDSTVDDALNLSDLLEDRIDPVKFFDENFKTKGMEILFDTAFRRFAGKSETGIIKLTQAMGGGKTHNMLALALLARHPELRGRVVPGASEKNQFDAGLENTKSERVPESDQQFMEAENQEHKATFALLTTIRETFVKLYYPKKPDQLGNLSLGYCV